jgi:hypothetical protein
MPVLLSVQTVGVPHLLWWLGCCVDSRGTKHFDYWQGEESFLERVETGCGAHWPPIQWVQGGPFHGDKAAGVWKESHISM